MFQMKIKIKTILISGAIATLLSAGCLSCFKTKTELPSPELKTGKISPADVSEFYLEPGEEASLAFKSNFKGSKQNLKYKISDIQRKEILSAGTPVSPDGDLTVKLKLPQGYYEITFPELKQTFGICALPRYKGGKDPFFNIDCAMSWWIGHKDLNRTIGMVRFLAKTGISQARERVQWTKINPEEGKYLFETDIYGKLRQAYADNDIEVLEMFHDAPKFLRGKTTSPYPEDFLKTYQAWTAITDKWSYSWGGLEIWNEPDLTMFGGAYPLDQYVPLAHTLAYLLEKENKNIPIGGPPFALNDIGLFKKALSESSIWNHLDFMSFHYYSDASGFENVIADYRKLLASKNKESMPIWITECGAVWENDTPPRPGFGDCMFFAHQITCKTVEARVCGITRFFPFVFAYYGQHKKGMMGLEGTPLRAMAAYAQTIKTLSNKAYAGDLSCSIPSASKVRVFSSGEEFTAVICTKNRNADQKIKLGFPVIKAEGIDGRELKINKDGSLPIPDGIAYVWFDKKTASSIINKNTTAMRLWNINLQAPPKKEYTSPLVVQFLAEGISNSKEAYFFEKEQAFTIRATNLSDKTIEAIIAVEAPEDWQFKSKTEQKISIAPKSSMNLKWTIALAPDFKIRLGRNYTGFIRVISSDASGKNKDILAIPVFPSLKENEYNVGNSSKKIKLDIADPTLWDDNICPEGKLYKNITPDGGIRFKFKFENGSLLTRWVHPLFHLPESLRDLRNSGLLITARSKFPLMFSVREKEKCGYAGSLSLIPSDGQWHTVFVSLNDSGSWALIPTHSDSNGKLDLDNIRMISLGASAFPAKEGEFEIKSMYLIK